jgi:transcriptional regulator of acetoin/glycerol metabolism
MGKGHPPAAGLGETLDQTWDRREHEGDTGDPVPGLLLVFSAGRPMQTVIPLTDGELILGRGPVGPASANVVLEDAVLSRRHARVAFESGRWSVADLGSRNGTAVDGRTIGGGGTSGEWRAAQAGEPHVIRVGDSLFLPKLDIRPYRTPIETGDVVMGPVLKSAFAAAGRAARAGESLHISGPSGAGKELLARAYHRMGPAPSGPFVAVNCASIPEGLAERLLFGARRGAYSGATADSDGYLQSAHGGTLFLDEIAELELSVQAKLLRVIETKEVLALGASKPRPVDVRVCCATHKVLRAEVAAGRFREDLYFRLGRPEVVVPPLRERLCEVPWLVAREISRVAPTMTPHISLVEACLLRAWPGNVRELLVEVRAAGREASAADMTVVEARHLAAEAGTGLEPPAPEESIGPPTREQIEAALAREGGNVARTARTLGVHRTQLRRWLARYGITPLRIGADEES